jgi:diphthamide biosynthesis protein 7
MGRALTLISHSASSNAIITSLSNGNLAHLVTDTDGSFTVEHAWHAHDYEPWITAWDLWQPDTVWSGKLDFNMTDHTY